MNGPTELPAGEARQFRWLLRWHLREAREALDAEGLDGEALARVLNVLHRNALEVATLAGAAPDVHLTVDAAD